MELWWKHTIQIADTLAFCLLKNHFHAAIYVKFKEDLPDIHLKKPSQYLANFFNAYTRGVNNATGRSGALFERPFERKLITDEHQLMRLIIYIHQNPQKHTLVADFREWKYSSYHELIGTQQTPLHREKVLELFGSRAGLIKYHQEILKPDMKPDMS